MKIKRAGTRRAFNFYFSTGLVSEGLEQARCISADHKRQSACTCSVVILT